MATTVMPDRTRTREQGRSPRPRASVRGREAGAAYDQQYDLLTAALIGATIGASLTFMLRRGPSGRRPVSPVMTGLGRGAGWAGRGAARAGKAGARWVAERGEDAWDAIPRHEIHEHMSEYLGRAREAIDDAVASELKDLRRAMRRQRKRLGI
ncbi:MAG TPA: hypothetical protein VHB25_05800 [Gemmatimonadaceae bacterium]|nr:hypothetical protein [Gemmatimonadaceae bacterium]